MDELGGVRRRGRGPELLLAHCARLDPDTPTARERLDEVLGPELAHKLVFALRAGSAPRIRERRVA
jgi:hypothetical protein